MGPFDQAPIRSLPAGPWAALLCAPLPTADTSIQGHKVGHCKSRTVRSGTPRSSQSVDSGRLTESIERDN